MKLYSGPMSLFARKTEITLGEKGLAYERVMVPFTQIRGYEPRDAEVIRINPKRQVPVLVDGDVELFDSTIIAEYLEEAYPAPALMPKGAGARARCRLFDLYADEIMLAPLKTLMHRTEPWEDAPRRAALEAEALKGEALLAVQFAHLDHELGSAEFFCGDFSLADIALFMTTHYAARLGGPSFKATPNLARWRQRLAARPVFARVIAEIAAADAALSRPVENAFRA